MYVKNKKDFEESILVMLILTIPLSFQTIIGINYSTLPISWFNILSVMLIVSILIKSSILTKKVKLNSLGFVGILLLLYLLVMVMISSSFIEGIKQLINVFIFIVLVILTPNLQVSERIKQELYKLYIFCTLALSIVVVLQAILFRIGREFGNVVLLGGTRYATGYLFSDYSFLSLYLISSVFFIIKLNMKFKYFLIFILLLASYVTTARTGIAAVVVISTLYFFFFVIKSINRNPIKVFLFSFIMVIIGFMGIQGLNFVRSGELLSDSGRLEGYLFALNIWLQHPLLGIGLDMSSYKELYGHPMPHNLFIQLLLQGGIIYFLLMSIFLLLIFYYIYRINRAFVWTYLLILCGAQFIPDILESRYLVVVVLLLLLPSSHPFKVTLSIKNTYGT